MKRTFPVLVSSLQVVGALVCGLFLLFPLKEPALCPTIYSVGGYKSMLTNIPDHLFSNQREICKQVLDPIYLLFQMRIYR
jgi:hypothetical protein